MILSQQFYYKEEDFIIITQHNRENAVPIESPWDIYKDKLNLAVGYIRWSDKKQNDGHSYAIQEGSIIAKAKRLGFDGIVIFLEGAKSAYRYRASKRKVITAMKEFIIENPNANTLIFYDESRLTRDITDFHKDIVIDLRREKPHIKFYSTDQEDEWNENDMLVQFRLTQYHNESLRKRDGIKGFHNGVLEMKKRPAANIPYGYSKSEDDKDVLVENENARNVILIFHLYSFGYSENDIAAFLEAAEIDSPSGLKKWSSNSVGYILNNQWYLGHLTWDVSIGFRTSPKKSNEDIKLIPNHHPPLIETGLWEITQNMRALKSNRSRMNSEFILKDIVYCASCDEPLKTKNQTSAKSKSDGSIYKCPNCDYKVKKNQLNQSVIDEFSHRWAREMNHYEKHILANIRRWEKTCVDRIECINNDIQAASVKKSLLDSNDPNFEQLLSIVEWNLKSLEAEKIKYVNAREKISVMLQDDITKQFGERFKQNFTEYSNVEKRTLLLQAIKKIKYDVNENEVLIEYRMTPYVELEDALSPKATVV